MTDLLTVKSPLDYKLTVGSPDENYISFEIEAKNNTGDLYVIITIPCGDATAGENYLCRDGVEETKLSFADPLAKVKGKTTRKKENVRWKSDPFSLKARDPVTIRITQINPEGAGEVKGKASLRLEFWDEDEGKKIDEVTPTVTVKEAPGDLAILEFDVSRTHVLQGTGVKISSRTIGANTVRLFAGDAEVPNGKEEKNPKSLTKRWDVKPEAVTTYRLEAWRTEPGSNKTAGHFVERSVVVTVDLRLQWCARDLFMNTLGGDRAEQLFYPTLLLRAEKDLSNPTTGERLYGIFVSVRGKTKHAELWSSSSGFDGWRKDADVPDGMGESPGVIHNEALWLIGGSSADPLGPVSNRVCWYYKKGSAMVFEEWDKEGSERKKLAMAGAAPALRRCHSCAVFNGEVWVLGGLSEKDEALDEVWTCSWGPKSGNLTPSWERKKPLPSGRCMSAAVGMTRPERRLWLYGGATDPYNLDEIFHELLWTEDGEKWTEFTLPKGMGKPLGATLLMGGDGYLHLIGKFEETNWDYALEDMTRKPPKWTDGPKPPFTTWLFPHADLFLIRSVSFRERWIVWPVYQYMDKMKNYETLIFNPPKVRNV
jgi:hypothetical protein